MRGPFFSVLVLFVFRSDAMGGLYEVGNPFVLLSLDVVVAHAN